MTWTPSRAPSSASASPTRWFKSSDSTTQGPAIRNGVFSKCCAISIAEAREFRRRLRRLGLGLRPRAAPREGGAHEPGEQRMRTHRPGLELRMELAADEPGMIGQLDHLDQRAVRREPRAPHAELGEHVAIGVRDLVAVAVPLAHLRRPVDLRRARGGPQPAGIGPEPHRAAHLLDTLLRAHQVNHRVLALRLELARIGVGQLADVASELDNRDLEPEANPEEGELALTRPADRL